ncbi:MAG: hypothetical protein LAN61_08720 [Acidobacteriia bacterium]|nr:hypothetical protein [Terriglobia bacterium]
MKKALLMLLLAMFFSGPAAHAQPAPCCTITAINSRAATVSAKVNSTGQSFEFRVPNAKLLAGLHPGQGIYANFKAKQVSLDGRTACCEIINLSPEEQISSPGLLAGKGTVAGTSVQSLQPGKCTHAWLPADGGVLCRGKDASRPAILLVHGLHQSAETWTKPSSTGYTYDFRHPPPEKDLGEHSAPNAGLYKAGPSELLNVDPLNWLGYLVAQGFTVATWSQPCCNFEKAYDSAKRALAQFAGDVGVMYPAAPPPIALVGHSRGGLLIHKLLREQGSLGGRIRWMITIHSPHHGSLVAKTPEVLVNDAEKVFDGANLPSAVKGPLREAAIKIVSPMHQLIDDGSKELAPDSPVITGLLNGDAPVPGVQYYTFGGTNPMIVRLYTWLFTPESAVPQYKGLEQYFHWKAKPAEVGLVSPLLDGVNAVVPEIKAGQGDTLVTDASARLPYSIHETDQLNHAEVLWDRPLQEKVARILSGALQPIHAGKPGDMR